LNNFRRCGITSNDVLKYFSALQTQFKSSKIQSIIFFSTVYFKGLEISRVHRGLRPSVSHPLFAEIGLVDAVRPAAINRITMQAAGNNILTWPWSASVWWGHHHPHHHHLIIIIVTCQALQQWAICSPGT